MAIFLYNYVSFIHFVVNIFTHFHLESLMQFKYSKTILERCYIASFNKTLSFQKLIQNPCFRQSTRNVGAQKTC